MDNDFLLDDFRVDPDKVLVHPPRGRRRSQQFIKVPIAWADRLATARYAATLKVAHRLLYEHWRGGGRPVQLANVALARNGVSRYQKRRALWELESLGLVQVERRARKSPIVMVIEDPV